MSASSIALLIVCNDMNFAAIWQVRLGSGISGGEKKLLV